MSKILSVTQILSPWNDFSRIDPARLEAAKQRGLRLHAAAAAKLTGTFQVAPLLPEDAGYWESLSAWIDDYVTGVFDVEPELRDARLGIAGHPDLVCRCGNYYRVVDFKTPVAESKTWRLQLAGYVHLATQNYKHHAVNWSGVAVQPHPEGKQAKAIIYHDPSGKDFQVLLSALNCYRYFAGGKKYD
jgi:hypothetical protein